MTYAEKNPSSLLYKNKSMKYSENQINFLHNNYPLRGGEFCASALGLSAKQIKKKAYKMKLKLLPD